MVDLLGDSRMDVCPFDVETIHGLKERIDVFLCQIKPINTILGCSVNDLVIHIGKVLDSFDIDATVLHVRLQHFKDHRRQRVT